MAFDKFLIAPLNSGLQRNVKPWLIPEDSFEELNNAYMFRGSLKKRFGSISLGTILDASSLSSRLRINLGATDGAGNISGTVPGATFKIGQQFSIGTEVFTVTALGAPGVMLTTGAATTHTYNTTTGAYVINGAAATTDCYFYPSEPVMGFANYESDALINEPTYAFDTQFAYHYTGGEWVRLATGGAAALWTSSNSDFFWSTSYRGATEDINILFTTNYNTTDRIRYWNGTTWASLSPATRTGAVDYIKTALIILPFQNRLVLLNTKEYVAGADKTFVNRCRYSQFGSPLAVDAFREDIDGKGDFIDAPTKESIVSAQILKNRLIVYFESSTYELVYTGNQVYPFIWQQINAELGCESTFSIIPFDKVVLGIGDNGIHACNGANVERIDIKIPDEVFEFHNDDEGPKRVTGIRDYYSEMVYWSVPDSGYYSTFPNRILAFNYRTQSWAFFDDSITSWGYINNLTDVTWATSAVEWQTAANQWNDGVDESYHKHVIAGNQQGYTFVTLRDCTWNAKSLSINNITESSGVVTIDCIDHNLRSGDWIHIEDCTGITELNDNNYKINYVDADSFTIDLAPAVTGTYTGAGTISLVSNIDVLTKEFNFYKSSGSNTYISKADFYISTTGSGETDDVGEITIDAYPSSSKLSLRDDSIATGTILGSSILETYPYTDKPIEAEQERFWHAVYLQSEGEGVQLRIYWSDDQMSDDNIPFQDFQLHGMLFHAMSTYEL